MAIHPITLTAISLAILALIACGVSVYYATQAQKRVDACLVPLYDMDVSQTFTVPKDVSVSVSSQPPAVSKVLYSSAANAAAVVAKGSTDTKITGPAVYISGSTATWVASGDVMTLSGYGNNVN